MPGEETKQKAIRATHHVPEGVSGVRLSNYVRGLFEQLPSRKSVKKAIKRGEVLIDGRVGVTADWVESGQTIELLPSRQRMPRPWKQQLPVVYEDDYIAIIYKPAGIPVNGNRYRTIENALLSNLQPSTQPDALPWAQPAHRLDAPTSGLVLVAKTARARMELGRQFQEKTIGKRYRALVFGKPPLTGRFDRRVEDKPATTLYRRVRSTPSARFGHLSLLDLYPLTGRKHQIRKHLSRNGYPILGDGKYNGQAADLEGEYFFLAAVALDFRHPITHQWMRLHRPEPEKFQRYFRAEWLDWLVLRALSK